MGWESVESLAVWQDGSGCVTCDVSIIEANESQEQTNIFSVSVLSKSCFVSDAFATAMMAGSLDYAKKLTKENDEIESMIIYLDDNDELKSFICQRFNFTFILIVF